MSATSKIEWTDASWNPVTGCTKVSPGCDNCYAETFAERWRGIPGHPYEQGFDLKLWPERLEMPLKWRKPRRVFVNSMSDLFHENVPTAYVAEVFSIMALAERHAFQVLTKRPTRMSVILRSGTFEDEFRRQVYLRGDRLQIPWPLPNVWLGTSIELDRYTRRADRLRAIPAVVRFLSLEPLLGPLPSLDLTDISWVIVGGESGPGHRPIDPGWVRDLRDRTAEAGSAFFFKQWGGRAPKANGRELDGREWSEFPAATVGRRDRIEANP